tara:strand:+ start:220 stop:462 length:243 start_codon:yes stop_codon:yes gene_type:complete
MTKQYIAHDENVIYGIGKSMIAATSDAGQNCPGFTGVLELQRCTDALALQVKTEGGSITWSESSDGTACTEDEYAGASSV